MSASAKKDASREMLVAALSGVVSGAIAKTITYPLDTTKTWLAKKTSSETSLDVIKQLWQTGLYIGIQARLTKNVIHNFAFFYLMEGITLLTKALVIRVRTLRNRPQTNEFGMLVFFLAAFWGDALNIPMIAPLEYVLAQIMTSKKSEGAISVIKRTHRQNGIGGFYAGWPVYLMASPRMAVKYGVLESIKEFLLRDKGRDAVLPSGPAFWLGAFSTAIASTIFYPVNTARIVITTRRKEGDADTDADTSCRHSNNPVSVMAAIAREEGCRGLFKGLTYELLESMLGAAIQLVIREKVVLGVRHVVYARKA